MLDGRMNMRAASVEQSFAAIYWAGHVARARANPHHRWRSVEGPARAVVNTLPDINWDPVGPMHW
eukprot:3404512-Pyramimonas_sp.AAC.1